MFIFFPFVIYTIFCLSSNQPQCKKVRENTLPEIDSTQSIDNSSNADQRVMEALISNSSHAIIVINPDKKILKFSRQAENLLGYLESDITGHSVERFFEDKTKAREIYRTIQEFGKIDQAEIVLLHKDGRKISISFSGKLLTDKDGKIIGQLGFMRDLREIQLVETRLKALIETSKVVNSISETKEILEHVVRSALLVIPTADRASIHFYNKETEKLELVISSFDYSRKAHQALTFQVGEGLAGWVFEHQHWVICNNTLTDSRYKRIDDIEVISHRSILSVPITSKQGKIGVINLSHSLKTEAFSQPDLDLLVGFADQAAIAIENSEQIARLRKNADELEFLHQVSLKINAHIHIEEILTAIVESGIKLLGTELAIVHWRGSGESKVHTFFAPEELSSLITNPRTENGLTNEIFRSGETVVIADTAQDPFVNPEVVKVGIRSLVGCPLKVNGRVAGVLYFKSRQRQFFGEHEIHLISLLLPLAAVAIENSNVIELLERSKRLSESLVQVSSDLASSKDLDEQMAALIQFMQVELAAPIFYLGLYDEASDVIHLKIHFEESVKQELIDIQLKERKEQTISSYVIKEQRPVFWNSDKQKQEECLRLGINPMKIGVACQTCVAFPLVMEGRTLGVISIQSTLPFAWDTIEVATFETLAHQASVAIHNVTLHQQVNNARETAMLVAKMTVLDDLKKTLDTHVNGVKDVLDCDLVTLYTYLQDKDQFDFQPAMAGKFHNNEKITETGTVSHNATPYRIIGMDEIYYVEDTQHDDILGSPFALRENVCSSVAAPLKVHGRWVGVLFINYCHSIHHFTKEEKSIIELFSLQAAIAISNAMLYEDEQKRRKVLKIIDEAGRVVTSSLQMDDVFDNLAQQAHKLTGEKGELANFATINLVEGNQILLKAVYPPGEEESIANANLTTVDLYEGINGRIGIIGRAVKNWTSVLVKNVNTHPDYLTANQDTRCELAVPIIYRNEVVGVINIEHNNIAGLDEEDRQNIESLAAHAAVAIQNARMYQALQRKNQHQNAIYDASKIIHNSIDLTVKELLDLLVEQMVEKIVPAAGAMNNLGVILLYDPEKKELKLECTYPQAAFGTHRIGQVRSLVNPYKGKIGITSRAVLAKTPQRVNDVNRNDDYLNYSKDTKSELDVPILDGETVLGVLSLECNQLNGFDKDAEDALSAFAKLAAIAIQNTRRYQELKETRSIVGNITAVAWMGLVAGAWRHSIGNMATTISDLSLHAQRDLTDGLPVEKINKRLEKIQEIVSEIQKIPMPPLSSEEGVEPINILQLVRDRVYQFKNKGRYKSIIFELACEIDELTTVRASSEWLRRILDILIDNASNSMREKTFKKINTRIVPKNEGIEILVTDTGVGIPDELRAILCKRPINKKKDEKGSGIGLFLANSIIQVYGGRLNIQYTGSSGTTMALWLPTLNDQG